MIFPSSKSLIAFIRGIKNLFTIYVPLADTVEIYDNSLAEPSLIAKKLSIAPDWVVHDSEIWQRIQENNTWKIKIIIYVSLDEVIDSALHAAFLRAADRAKQTHTYLVIERKGKIERIPYEKIDSFIAQKKIQASR